MTTFSGVDQVQTRAAENSVVTDATIDCQKSNETFDTLDTLFEGKLKLLQSRSGYRVSLDAVLLAHFATIRDNENIADLGTGNGVIPLILAHLHRTIFVTGVEFQIAMMERACRNVQLNGFDKRIRIARGDVRVIEKISGPGSFDAVVCNPPYRQPSSGRLSPNREKQLARHECEGGLGDFIAAGAYLLPAKGRMALIYSAVRSIDLLVTMRHSGIEPKRVRMVHSSSQTEASLILVEGVKGGRSGVKVHAPLVIYEQGKKYTMEIKAMLTGSAGYSGTERSD